MAPRSKTDQPRSSLLSRCRLILGTLVVLQMVSIVLLHSSGTTTRDVSSLASSLMIAETLQSFVMETATPNNSIEPRHAINKQNYAGYSYLKGDSENLWSTSRVIPPWMKDYFQWHADQMAQLNETSWKDMRFLIMQCLKDDPKCGGTADRLKSVPTMILLASQTRRVLLIRWERPCKLEEFLVPPRGGMDWRVPDWLAPQLPRKPFGSSLAPIQRLARSDLPVAMARYQSYNHGSPYFDEHTNGTGVTFESVYHELWKMVFTPVPPIVEQIATSLHDMGLVPGHYAAAHLRALYARKSREASDTKRWAINAVNCASNLDPGKPIYFASDSSDAVAFVQTYAAENNRQVVSLQDDASPLHLEKAENWQSRQPSEYYATFRDLYLLGLGHCVAYNVGGFGNWGLLLSDDVTCGMRYVLGNAQKMIPCSWKDSDGQQATVSNSHQELPLYPPIDLPIELHGTETDTTTEKKTTEPNEAEKSGDASVHVVKARTTKDSSTLPPWLEEYFRWHAEQRKELSESNWESKRFLVMQCALEDGRCGGTSDRLKPLPVLLYLAHRSKRILLIYWTRPCKLEEFLVPPEGGLDWRVPSWLEPKLVNTKKLIDLRRINKFVDGNDVIIRTRVQSNDGGWSFFAEQTNGTSYANGGESYARFYHQSFHTVFTPSPPVAEIISVNMKRLGLKPGEYAAAHLRAMYARDHRPEDETARLAINAVNCASQLRPGGPIYFAADSKHAVESVQKYAKTESRPIVSLIHEEEPLHLEKAENATTRPPSDYYATFVDLYLLGESRCLSYSNGGFGTWGLLLGYNSSCSSRHFKGSRMTKCDWADALPAR